KLSTNILSIIETNQTKITIRLSLIRTFSPRKISAFLMQSGLVVFLMVLVSLLSLVGMFI
ncbi:MAG: hypothetical protein M3209_08770, partial [Acidobacteriota bacterium]|nr:hypothetical protein [Acidobacteriota bacterium]